MATRVPSTRSDFYVYCLCRDNGIPFYIGKGRGDRWVRHERQAIRGARGYKFAIIRGMLARSVEMPMVRIHEGLTEAIAHEYEVSLIKAIGRHPHGPLANLTDGGDGVSGLRHSPETLAKLAASSRGRKHSPEHIAKTAATNTGKRHSAKTRARMSEWQIGRKMPREGVEKAATALRGRKQSPEHIEKCAATRRGRRYSPEHRANISVAKQGKPPSPATIKASTAFWRGRKQLPESIAKRTATRRANKLANAAEALKNNPAWKPYRPSSPKQEAHITKMSAGNVGRKHSPETILKRLATQRANKRAKAP